jgi:hypothetical protein
MSRRFERERFATIVLAQRHIPRDGKLTCRVCGRELHVGEHAMFRTWHVGFSCIEPCGWTLLSDVEHTAAWQRCVANKPMEDDDALWLASWGVVALKSVRNVKKLEWTAVGRRLRDEYRARAA